MCCCSERGQPMKTNAPAQCALLYGQMLQTCVLTSKTQPTINNRMWWIHRRFASRFFCWCLPIVCMMDSFYWLDLLPLMTLAVRQHSRNTGDIKNDKEKTCAWQDWQDTKLTKREIMLHRHLVIKLAEKNVLHLAFIWSSYKVVIDTKLH